MGTINSTCSSCEPYVQQTNKIQTLAPDNLLLLGSESADTSRILRQMEYQHTVSTANNDLTKYIISIRKHCVSSTLKLYRKAQSLYQFNPVNYSKFDVDSVDLNTIKLLQSALAKFNDNSWIKNHANIQQISESIHSLWALDSLKSVWELLYSSNANISYFLDQISTIMNGNEYTPTYEDIMLMPYSNMSEISLTFQEGQPQLNMVAMNGTKYIHSKKWLQSFDDANGILFVVSLGDISALKESLFLFKQIVNDKKLSKIPVILIFDKFDLFVTQLNNGSDISSVFDGFYSDCDHRKIGESLAFIKKQFLNAVMNRSKRRGIYVHTTCLNRNNFNTIQQIFKDVQHIKVTNNLNAGGLL